METTTAPVLTGLLYQNGGDAEQPTWWCHAASGAAVRTDPSSLALTSTLRDSYGGASGGLVLYRAVIDHYAFGIAFLVLLALVFAGMILGARRR